MYWKINEYGEKVYCQPISLNITALSFDKENIKDIDKAILEVLNDKAFDGICWFEPINGDVYNE